MKKYLLIKSDEDGEPCSFYEDIQDILDNPEDYGIEKFLTKIPDKDPMYWEEGAALLLEIKILKPVTKTTAYRIEK